MQAMTARQQEILDYINSCQGVAPTLRQIAKHFGFLRHAAFQHVTALRRQGLLPPNGRTARKFTPRPVRSTAGLKDKDYTLIEARGGFFASAGAKDGDMILLRRYPLHGELVVVSDDCNPIIKRFVKTRLHNRLDPVGAEMQTVILKDGVKLKILGAVVAIIRKPP